MANICVFNMKIWGEKKNIDTLCDMLDWRGEFEQNGLGRVYEFDSREGNGWAELYGSCAWSVWSAMIDTERNLIDATADLALAVEVYSSEPGMAFQEHHVIDKGEHVINECVDYMERLVEDMDEDELTEFASEIGVTVEHIVENVNENGDYAIGGFEDWSFSEFGRWKAAA